MLLSCTCHAFVMLMILVVHTASGGVKAATAMHPGGGSESSSERARQVTGSKPTVVPWHTWHH